MTTAEAKQIGNLLDDWAGAMRRKDADAIIAHQNDDILQFSLAPPLRIVGNDKAALRQWLDTWEGDLIYDLARIEIHASADNAWCTCLARLGGTKSGQGTISFWMRQTIGFHRIDGVWKIVHTHESVPFSMEGEPVPLFDLQP